MNLEIDEESYLNKNQGNDLFCRVFPL